MPYFKCFIEGRNFPGALVGGQKPIGFYVTRFVEAPNIETAEQKALKALKQEEQLIGVNDLPGKENARVYFEEIEEISKNDILETLAGFTFFDMEDDEDSSHQQEQKNSILQTFLRWFQR